MEIEPEIFYKISLNPGMAMHQKAVYVIDNKDRIELASVRLNEYLLPNIDSAVTTKLGPSFSKFDTFQILFSGEK